MTRFYLFGALALIFLVQAPFIFALDCNSLSEASRQTCLEIMSSNLSQQEKESIVSNLDYSKIFFPDHNYVLTHNINLPINNAPNGISSSNGIFVKNAWISIFAVMPSVIYNNSLYVPSQTKVLTGFNYQIQTPSNYYSSGYPSTSQGDCKRIYTLTRNTAENKVYVNDNYQGSGKLVNINLNQDSQIKTNYLINVAYSIDHYYWQRYCSRYSNGYCIKHSYRCKFDYNEVQQDNIQISDNLNVKVYNDLLRADIFSLDSFSANSKIRLNYSNSFELSFKDASYNFYDFSYNINYSKAPYYVYTLKAESYGEETLSNIQKSNNDFLIKDPQNCKIKAFDFFNVISKDCYLSYNSIDFYINTDKLTYLPNETIKVSIFPSNISVNLTYGDQSKIVIGSSSFKVVDPFNKITAYYGEIKTEKIIFVKDGERIQTVFNLSIFGFLNYFFYAVLRKYWGGFI